MRGHRSRGYRHRRRRRGPASTWWSESALPRASALLSGSYDTTGRPLLRSSSLYMADPALRIAIQTTAQQGAHRRRRVRGQGGEVGLLRYYSREVLGYRLARICSPACEYLEKRHAERPDVRALIDGLALRLF